MTDNEATIAALNARGFRIAVKYYRTIVSPVVVGEFPATAIKTLGLGNYIQPRGGKVRVYAIKDGITVVSESVCSQADTFNRAVGLSLALARLPLP